MKLDHSKFVRTWQAAGSCGEVAKAMKMSLGAVRTAASTLRSKGVPLKRFPKGIRAMDVSGLKDLAKSLSAKATAKKVARP